MLGGTCEANGITRRLHEGLLLKGDRDPDRWLTLTHQREAIERWCRDHRHRLVDLRRDIDVSGASADRPNLEQLVEQIEAGNLARASSLPSSTASVAGYRTVSIN